MNTEKKEKVKKTKTKIEPQETLKESQAEREKTERENQQADTDKKYNRLYRSTINRVLGGVAGGLGEYLNIDPTIIRLVFILLSIFGGSGVLLYLILWLIIPSEPNSRTMEENIRKNAQEIKTKAEGIAGDWRNSSATHNRRFWIGIIVVAFGVIFLLNNFGFSINIGRFWPLWLILIGVILLLRK